VKSHKEESTVFTEKEIEYLKQTQTARLGTVGPDGQPDVVPVRFEFDGQAFYVGGQYMEKSRKYKNVMAGNEKVALAIDDFVQTGGPMPDIRGIRVYGVAESVQREGWRGGMSTQFKITPTTTWSWGLEGPSFDQSGFVTNKTEWAK
jgi:pyridoxamine 5'-phosphate oxidase family protein